MTTSPGDVQLSSSDSTGDLPRRVRIGPTADRDRSLAPDLARGGVLLFIALANVWGYLYGQSANAAHRPTDGTWLAHILDFMVGIAVDDRSRPMFAMLFGYGTWHMMRRQKQAGASAKQAQRLVLRRNIWLIVFGLVHAGLLFQGDILALYGVTGLVALLVWNRTRVIKIIVASWGFFAGATLLAFLFAAGAGEVVTAGSDYFQEAVSRLVNSGLQLVVFSILPVFLAPFLVGVVLAERGILERPWDHQPLLSRLALYGVGIGLVGGIPYALVAAGLWSPAKVVGSFVLGFHQLTGMACGLGYLALFGLWSARRRGAGQTGFAVSALAATGKRSLSCYLTQSVILASLLSAWGVGLGGKIGTPTAYLIAVLTWLTSVVFAVALERAGRRGPAEVLLRRLVYSGIRRPRAITGSSRSAGHRS